MYLTFFILKGLLRKNLLHLKIPNKGYNMIKENSLTGLVHVAIYDSDLKNQFNYELAQLEKFGWDIPIINASQKPNAPASIVVCENLDEAKKHNAILPDGFSILSALGGGKIEKSLVEGIGMDAGVDKVIVGLNWSMVQAGEYCGIARSPSRGTEGARTIRPQDGFKNKSLKDMAKLIYSCDELSRSIGLAAINAFYNRPKENIQEKQKWGFANVNPPGDDTVIIGDFGKEMKKRLPMAKVVEREPKQNQVDATQAKDVISNTNKLIITGQTLSNGSLEPILLSSQEVKWRMLLGPSVPLAPALLKQGLNQLSGTAVHDIKATERFILETGSMIMLDNLVQKIALSS